MLQLTWAGTVELVSAAAWEDMDNKLKTATRKTCITSNSRHRISIQVKIVRKFTIMGTNTQILTKATVV